MGIHHHHVSLLVGEHQFFRSGLFPVHTVQKRAVGLAERRPLLIHVVQVRIRAAPPYHVGGAVAGNALRLFIPVHNGTIRLHYVYSIGEIFYQLKEILFINQGSIPSLLLLQFVS